MSLSDSSSFPSPQVSGEEGSPQDSVDWPASPVEPQRNVPLIHIEECPALPPSHGPDTHTHTGCVREGSTGREEGLDTSILGQEEKSFSTNGTFSEPEEEEEEEDAVAAETETSNGRILPPSVLDQASVIAERFAGNLSRRNSLVMASAAAAVDLPLGAPQQSRGSPGDAPLQNAMAAADPLTPATATVEADRTAQRQQDSTLSRKDRLLIHKIRRYYEHAEHQDMGFCLKRRESLSYIPAGLVRHLSRQINGGPEDEASADASHGGGNRKGSPSARPTSWSVFNLPALDKKDETKPKSPAAEGEAMHSGADKRGSKRRAASVTDVPHHHGDTPSPSHDLPAGQEAEAVREDRLASTEMEMDEQAEPRMAVLDQESFPSPECSESLLIQEQPNLCPLTDLACVSPPSAFLSPTKEEAPETRGSDRALQQRGRPPRAPLPRIITLRSGTDEEQIQDAERMKNKVFQLARQYSQRIKNNRPVLRVRPRDTEGQLPSKNLACVQEERSPGREKGMLPSS